MSKFFIKKKHIKIGEGEDVLELTIKEITPVLIFEAYQLMESQMKSSDNQMVNDFVLIKNILDKYWDQVCVGISFHDAIASGFSFWWEIYPVFAEVNKSFLKTLDVLGVKEKIMSMLSTTLQKLSQSQQLTDTQTAGNTDTITLESAVGQ